MHQRVLEVVKVARPGFWPTQLWFYLLPMAGQNMFGSLAFWIGAFYVCFPLGLLLYGWNDLGDAETDRINPRKDSWLFGARPDATLRSQLPWIIAFIQLPFVVAFVLIAGPKMLVWFVAVLATNFTYNNAGWKRRPILDVLNQAGYVLIFVLASWLCGIEQLSTPVIVFSAMFAMQSHLFGQLMDLDEDRIAGRRSTAIVLGGARAKALLSLFMWIEAGIAAMYFRGTIVALFMACGAMFFLVDAFVGPPRYSVTFTKAFFIAWNVIVLVTMHFVWRYGWFMLASTSS
jgi:4-hydroxybenzoate polyprenyltransferase